MTDLAEYCAPGATYNEEMISVSEHVSLRLITFSPAEDKNNPPVLFVAGWISLMSGWKEILQEMTKDFQVYYVETREKITSQVKGRENFGVEDIGKDLVALVSLLKFTSENYILLGSSLGATAILDCCQHLTIPPKCLVLIGPNAVFRVPRFGKAIVSVFWPRMYLVIKPLVKFYLKNFRLDVKSDYAQYQKYCTALDTANPWKLKNAVMRLWSYEVWDLLGDIAFPSLIVGASKDDLHEPENLKKIVSMMPHATYVDLETNKGTHSKPMVDEVRNYLKTLK